MQGIELSGSSAAAEAPAGQAPPHHAGQHRHDLFYCIVESAKNTGAQPKRTKKKITKLRFSFLKLPTTFKEDKTISNNKKIACKFENPRLDNLSSLSLAWLWALLGFSSRLAPSKEPQIILIFIHNLINHE